MKKNRNQRIFLTSFFCTLCVILLAMGIFIADSRSRETGFNDGKTLFRQITGKNFLLSCIAAGICYN